MQKRCFACKPQRRQIFPRVVRQIPKSQESPKPVVCVTDLWHALQICGMREKMPTGYVSLVASHVVEMLRSQATETSDASQSLA